MTTRKGGFSVAFAPFSNSAGGRLALFSGGDPRRDSRRLAGDLPIYAQIVRAADTFSYDPAIGEDDAREMWMVRPPGRTTVAVDDDGTIAGTANMFANRPGPGDHVASGNYMVAAASRGRASDERSSMTPCAGRATPASVRCSSTRWRRATRPPSSSTSRWDSSPSDACPGPSATPSTARSVCLSCISFSDRARSRPHHHAGTYRHPRSKPPRCAEARSLV